jgi:peptide deformylase
MNDNLEENMAIRTIRIDGDPILRKKAKAVTVFDDRLRALAEDMIETMHEAEGVGLAGNQVGVLKRIFVIDMYDEVGPQVLINPVIVNTEDSQTGPEGCLSVPGRAGIVERPMRVTVKYQDLDGNEQTITGEALRARALCHETDHLDGIMYTDLQIEEIEDEDDEDNLEEDME